MGSIIGCRMWVNWRLRRGVRRGGVKAGRGSSRAGFKRGGVPTERDSSGAGFRQGGVQAGRGDTVKHQE